MYVLFAFRLIDGTVLIRTFLSLQVQQVPFVVFQKEIDRTVPHGRNYYQTGMFVKVYCADTNLIPL